MSDSLVALLRFYLQPEPWMDYAACKGMGPDLFFPKRGQPKRPGLAVCARCPVTAECGEYAVRSESEDGIWGGFLRTRGMTTSDATPEPQPQPDTRRTPMIPKTLSATSIQAYEECPKRFEAEYLLRAPSPGGSAASLGTACHETIEPWVADGHYKKGYADEWSVMKALYDQAYWAVFSDPSRYDEGVNMLKGWLARQDWSGREVLSTEEKKNFVIKTSVGDIPLNYIMDRKDRLDNGDIEVVDYKTLSLPLSPEQLKHKIQARVYALAAQLEHPEAERIWVTFDMLRYDAVGIVFTKEENRATWKYLHALAERIIADAEPREQLGTGCRFCVRRLSCDALTRHSAVGGSLSMSDPAAAAERRYALAAAKSAIEQSIKDLDEFITDHCRANELLGYEAGDYAVRLTVSGRRQADSSVIAGIIGPDLTARYGDIKVSAIDNILKSDDLTDEQKSMVRQSIRKVFGEPTVKIDKKGAF